MEIFKTLNIRRDLINQWITNNPVIQENELICVVCLENNALVNKYKIGDGKSHYVELKMLDNIPPSFCIITTQGTKYNINLNGIDLIFGNDKSYIKMEKRNNKD